MVELIRLLKKLEQQVAQCSRCGICQSVCPLYNVTKNESDVARGKLMLLDGLMRSFFEDPRGVWERLDRCLLCGSCAANCPRKVDAVALFLSARVILSAYIRMPLIKKIIFRYLLSNPNLFDRVISWGAKWQHLFFKKKPAFQSGVSCGAMVSPLLSNRHWVPLAPVPFHKISPRLKPLPEKTESPGGLRVAFFVGCLLDKVFPNVAADIVKVLNFHNVEVVIPSNQGCCGIPALSSGDQLTFNRLAAHSLNRFDPADFDYLVTGCATCTATIKKIWPAMFQPASEAQSVQVGLLVEKTFDINQFLIDIIKVPITVRPEENSQKLVVTYHDPCHLRKTLNIFSEPRRLIQANDRYSFTEMPDAASCCGMGGSFNLAHYSLSADIGKKKAAAIESTGAAVVATGCPACMIQLSDMLAAEKKQTRVAHVVELYCEKIFGADSNGHGVI